MNAAELVKEASKNGAKFKFDDGALHSIEPPETLFGATYFAHMIPPFKPSHTLMLGYGWGTVAELMRKIYGNDLKITAVDIIGYQKVDAYIEYKMEVADAKDYVWDSTDSVIKRMFDYVAIDLWDGKEVPNFIFHTEFVVRLREMAKRMICLNIPAVDVKKLKSYLDYGFKFERFVPIEGNSVQWWSI